MARNGQPNMDWFQRNVGNHEKLIPILRSWDKHVMTLNEVLIWKEHEAGNWVIGIRRQNAFMMEEDVDDMINDFLITNQDNNFYTRGFWTEHGIIPVL